MHAKGLVVQFGGMRLAVTADDRTGAMEAAALCADAGFATVVVSWDGEPAIAECVVTDLRSRHLTPGRAADRMTASSHDDSGGRRVHKIDSTLRGNWAAEIGVLLAERRRVLIIPAYPAAGRTCVGGVVLADGVPVADTEFGRDPTAPVTSSRPAEALAAVEVATLTDLDGWLASVGPPSAVAIADAETDKRIDELVAAAAEHADVVIAGPAAAVGAVARWMSPVARRDLPTLPVGPVLVVCGSLHSTSRSQAAVVLGHAGVTVIEAHSDGGTDREVVALELAFRAHEYLAAHRADLVVLLGGDTADAFIGDRSVFVHGSVGVGMAFGTVTIDGRPLAIITKPGGFGATNSLVDLLAARGGQEA